MQDTVLYSPLHEATTDATHISAIVKDIEIGSTDTSFISTVLHNVVFEESCAYTSHAADLSTQCIILALLIVQYLVSAQPQRTFGDAVNNLRNFLASDRAWSLHNMDAIQRFAHLHVIQHFDSEACDTTIQQLVHTAITWAFENTPAADESQEFIDTCVANHNSLIAIRNLNHQRRQLEPRRRRNSKMF